MTMFEAYSDSRPPNPVEDRGPDQEHEKTPDLFADAGAAPSGQGTGRDRLLHFPENAR
ncbi:hypothetical protein [Streptomyces sp. NPDC048349]|uniref:hypothetical protein n=1 Tax=Streptomyces sp. NPDC048349 TaxID=3155486 RepID=UPI0034334728